MRGARVTQEEKDAMRTLREEGLSYAAIGRRLNRAPQTVHFVLNPRERKRRSQRRPGYAFARIVETPSDLFTVGGGFRMIDLAYSVKLSALPDGLIFEIGRDGLPASRATMRDGKLVREDGRCLVWTGGRCVWQMIEVEATSEIRS